MEIEKITNWIEDGLSEVTITGKGKGVVATKHFRKGEILCEYRGETLSLKDAKEREKEYLEQHESRCFMYYFDFKHTKFWLV